MSKSKSQKMSEEDTPLAFIDEDRFGKLDKAEKDFICKEDALDLVLIENAGELFRILMQEGYRNDNIEKVLKMIGKERKHTIFLPTETFAINQEDGTWMFTDTEDNKTTLRNYIKKCSRKIKNKVYDDSIIYTIVGLDLEAGGHYGSLICDMEDEKIWIFDSMSGVDLEGDNFESGTEKIFLNLAKQLFIGDDEYDGLDLDADDFDVEAVENGYFLQPTGGFEEFIAPVLQHMHNNKKWKEHAIKINVQHVESQNHFCYIWSIWFCQIYLRGKVEHYQEVYTWMDSLDMIPLVVIKKYILGFIQLLKSKVEYKDLFYKHFPRLWSNHEDPLENKFHLYEFEWTKPNTIQDCLDNSYDEYEIKKIKNTDSTIIQNDVKCK